MPSCYRWIALRPIVAKGSAFTTIALCDGYTRDVRLTYATLEISIGSAQGRALERGAPRATFFARLLWGKPIAQRKMGLDSTPDAPFGSGLIFLQAAAEKYRYTYS